MHSQTRFKVNSPQVIRETFDDEVVLVNLNSGNYYSLEKTGAEIWDGLEQGATVGEIATLLLHRYEGDPQAIEQAVSHFVDELQREDILLPLTEPHNATVTQANATFTPNNPTAKHSFEAPVLQKYTDMQELLLLDPIHEVDESGWPKTKA